MKSLKGFWAVVAACMVISGCATTEQGPKVALPAPYEKHDVAVTVDSLLTDSNGDVWGLSGTATNEGSDLATCMLTFDIMDASGAKVGDAIASIEGLRSNQTWRFQATISVPSSVYFTSIQPGQVMAIPRSDQ